MFYIQEIEAASPDLTGLSCSFIPPWNLVFSLWEFLCKKELQRSQSGAH